MAGRLLDSNTSQEHDTEYTLNLRTNIDDALGVLGTLNVGLDVNPRFHDIEAFETTKELTVFDLLDIKLGEELFNVSYLIINKYNFTT